jgi:hypothetical protein
MMCLVVILLLNLLIAMMGDTYAKIAEIKNEWMRQVSSIQKLGRKGRDGIWESKMSSSLSGFNFLRSATGFQCLQLGNCSSPKHTRLWAAKAALFKKREKSVPGLLKCLTIRAPFFFLFSGGREY